MKRTILSDHERKLLVDYLAELPQKMPGQLRHLRHRAKHAIDIEEMRSDLDLVERLRDLDIKTGRPYKYVKPDWKPTGDYPAPEG